MPFPNEYMKKRLQNSKRSVLIGKDSRRGSGCAITTTSLFSSSQLQEASR